MLWCHTCHGVMGCPFGGIDESKVLDLCLCLCYGQRLTMWQDLLFSMACLPQIPFSPDIDIINMH